MTGVEIIEASRREAVIAVIAAVDRLNSWVRSDSYRESMGGGPREAVYWLKNEAIRALHGYDLTTHRRVEVSVKCRDCGGSGRYCDSMGYRHDHCWACNSSGTATLDFVETSLAGGPTWHSPRWKFPHLPGVSTLDMEPVAVFDWKPNQPGRNLTPAEVARDLNAVEAVFPKRPGLRFTDWGEYDPFDYKLFVGSSPRDRCDLCGVAVPDDSGCGHHCSRGRIAWSAYACLACMAIHKHESSARIFDLFDLPRSFVDHPDILEWIARHPVKPKRCLEREEEVVDDDDD